MNKFHNRGRAYLFVLPLKYRDFISINYRDSSQAQATQPDLILMDVVMPVMTGIDTVQALRKQPDFARTPIIAISASVSAVDLEQSQSAGCDAFLPKPIEADKLFNLFARLLPVEWISADAPPAEPVVEEQAKMVLPAHDDLKALYELAALGKVLDIQQYVEALEAQDVRYQPFSRKIRVMAQAFEDERIAVLIKQYMERTE